MSSPNLPTLTVDVRSRRLELRVALFALMLGAGAPWLAGAFDATGSFVASVAVVFAIGCGLRQAGWIGSRRRLAAFSWLADGRWLLTDTCSTTIEAELCADARVADRCVWLRWKTGSGRFGPRRSLLLGSADVPECDLRRLITRLRIEGVGQGRHASEATLP